MNFANQASSSYSNKNIIFRTVKYSHSDLLKTTNVILDLFKANAIDGQSLVYSVAVDEEQNKLLIRGKRSNFTAIENILRSVGIDMNAIVLEHQDGPPTLMGAIFGGTKVGFTLDSVPGMYLCTAGFNAIVDGIYPAIITTAHCYENSPAYYKYAHFNLGSSPTGSIRGERIGEFFGSAWGDSIDAGLFGNANFVHSLYPQIITNANNLVSVKSLIPPKQNAQICTSGGSSGWRCGTQKALVSLTDYKGKRFAWSESTFCGAPGDSGGPVVSQQNNAIGLFVGAMSNNSGETCGPTWGGAPQINSLYQPLGPYFEKFPGVKIMTN